MVDKKPVERKSRNSTPAPWRIPVAVEKIAEAGQHYDLVADPGVRAEVARIAGLRDLPRLEAKFDVTRHGAGGMHVVGHVSATVGQNCVLTLEPLANEIEETVDLVFLPQRMPLREEGEAEMEPRVRKWNDPEPLIGGGVDLGALATEFLILGLDPYPRKPDAVFEPPQDQQADDGPFAALAKLTKD
jgi:hypothetical protein